MELTAAKNLILKLYTERVKVVGRVFCVQRPGGVCHRGVVMGLEVVDETLVGDDAGFFNPYTPFWIDVDIAARVGKGEEGVLNDYFVGGVLQVYPHVLVVRHRIVQVIIDDFRPQVTGTFSGVGDDRVEVDLEVKEAGCWGAGIAVVGEFVATNC